MVGSYPLPANIRQGWKWLTVVNTSLLLYRFYYGRRMFYNIELRDAVCTMANIRAYNTYNNINSSSEELDTRILESFGHFCWVKCYLAKCHGTLAPWHLTSLSITKISIMPSIMFLFIITVSVTMLNVVAPFIH